MESYEYYQFINTLDIEPFAPEAYHFWGVLDGEFVHGSYIRGHNIVAFSDHVEWDDDTMEDIKKIVEEKIEELEEEEMI